MKIYLFAFLSLAILLLLSGALIPLGCDYSSPVSLRNPVWYETGKGPHFVASGDLNHDSHLDLVVANCHSSDISVFLGAGDGTFTRQSRFRTHRGPTCLQVGRLDDDPHEDIVISCFIDDTVDILRGDGKGEFEFESIETGKGTDPHAVVIDDFNLDSLNDIAVANGGTNEVMLFYGNERGGFSKPMRLPVGKKPYSLLCPDLNKDRIPDIVTGNFASNDISVLLGDEEGMYKQRKRYSVGRKPNIIDAGDLDGDGNLDIAVGNCISGSVSILSGDGRGKLEEAMTLPCDEIITSVEISDFSRNIWGDLIVLSGDSRMVTFYQGRGGLKFKRVFRCITGDGPCHLLWEDINGDAKNDLVVTNMSSDNMCVFLAE